VADKNRAKAREIRIVLVVDNFIANSFPMDARNFNPDFC